jgi:hypothetical protein
MKSIRWLSSDTKPKINTHISGEGRLDQTGLRLARVAGGKPVLYEGTAKHRRLRMKNSASEPVGPAERLARLRFYSIARASQNDL